MPRKKKSITYDQLKIRVRNRYKTMKKDNDGKALKTEEFKKMVNVLFNLNEVDPNEEKGRKWYKALMLEFASRGGVKSSKVPKKKGVKKNKYTSYKQTDFNFLKNI